MKSSPPFRPLLIPLALLASLTACTGITRVEPKAPAVTGSTESASPDPAASTPASALTAQIDALKTQITKRQGYNAQLREAIEGYENRIPAVLATDRTHGPSVQEFDFRTSIQAKLGEIDRAAKSWQETIDAHSAVVAKSESDPRHGELQSEVNELTEIRAELLRQRTRLTGLLGKLQPTKN